MIRWSQSGRVEPRILLIGPPDVQGQDVEPRPSNSPAEDPVLRCSHCSVTAQKAMEGAMSPVWKRRHGDMGDQGVAAVCGRLGESRQCAVLPTDTLQSLDSR